MARTLIERLGSMVDSERLRSEAGGLLEELIDAVRPVSEALETLLEAADGAGDYVAQWSEAEEREEKAEAREAALGLLGELVEAAGSLPDGLLTLVLCETD